jgi:hypothetical protein
VVQITVDIAMGLAVPRIAPEATHGVLQPDDIRLMVESSFSYLICKCRVTA